MGEPKFLILDDILINIYSIATIDKNNIKQDPDGDEIYNELSNYVITLNNGTIIEVNYEEEPYNFNKITDLLCKLRTFHYI